MRAILGVNVTEWSVHQRFFPKLVYVAKNSMSVYRWLAPCMRETPCTRELA